MSSPRPGQPRRARHLIDFDNPPPRPQAGGMSLTQVQRWVLSVLAVTTIFHMSAGIVVAAFFVDGTRAGAGVGLLVIAALFGALAVAAGLGIHGRSLASWWLLLGAVPSLVGAYFMFGR